MATGQLARPSDKLRRVCFFAALALIGACASNPPPPPPPAPPPSPAASETLPPTSAEVDAGAPAAEAAQAQVECQGAEECKAKGAAAAGMEWTCDNGRCMEQAAAAPKAEEKSAADQGEKPAKSGKKKGKKK
jgi:hypothetical protein